MKKYAPLIPCVMLAACSMVDDAEEYSSETMSQGILNGTALTNNHKVDLPGCSGTALTNEWILTAAHCLSHYMDHTFDGDGKHYITNGLNGAIQVPQGSWRSSAALGVDAQNRSVVAIYDSSRTMRVVRLLESGALDLSFGTSGVVEYDTLPTTPEDLIINDSGDIFVLATTTYQGAERMAVFKIRADGTFDTSFSGDGVRIPVFGSATSEQGASIDLDSQGRIVVGGTLFTGSGSKYALFRLMPSSSLDTAFDYDGKVVVEFASSTNNTASEVGVDPYDDTVYMVGTSTPSSGNRVALMRLRADGQLHTQFDYDGKAYLSFQNREAFAGGMSVDAITGDVIVGATVTLSGSTRESGVQRITWTQTAGTPLELHPSFGTRIYPHRSDWSAIAMKDVSRTGYGTNTFGDRMVLVGSAVIESRLTHTFTTFDPDTGELDSPGRRYSQRSFTFGSGDEGMTTKVVTLPDGRFTTAGRVRHTASNKREATVTRLSADFLTREFLPWEYPVKVGGTTSSVFAEVGYAHPDYDVGLIKLTQPLSIDGSTSGYWEPMSTRTVASLEGEVITCYGYGQNSPNGAWLDLDVRAVSSVPRLLSRARLEGTGMCHGDSGGGCFDPNGDLVSVHVSGNKTSQGCTSPMLDAGSVPTQNFRDWALDILFNN